MTVNHPQWGTMCEICFNGLTPDMCAVDNDGQKWDVCKGGCAQQAGIIECNHAEDEHKLSGTPEPLQPDHQHEWLPIGSITTPNGTTYATYACPQCGQHGTRRT